MRTPYKKIFNDPKKLDELLELTVAGKSSSYCAKHFNCDRTSILYQLRKNFSGFKQKVKQEVRYKREGHCKICDMLLSSNHHKENPCIQ